MSNTNSWDIKSLKRNLIKLNNVKQRKKTNRFTQKGSRFKKERTSSAYHVQPRN